MAKPDFIELPGYEPIAILYEDRSVLAVGKLRRWIRKLTAKSEIGNWK